METPSLNPVFMAMESCPGENRFWGMRNIKDGGYTQLLSQHFCWDPQVYHNNDLRNRWAHFATSSMVLSFDLHGWKFGGQVDAG